MEKKRKLLYKRDLSLEKCIDICRATEIFEEREESIKFVKCVTLN